MATARTFTKKLFQIQHENTPPAYVLADNVPDAVRQWQGSSIALAKADPSAVVLVSDDVIGAPPRGPESAKELEKRLKQLREEEMLKLLASNF